MRPAHRSRAASADPDRAPGGLSGRVFNIQRFSVHDGPGIRTTVFLKGCPLRCIWCHNPESLSPERELTILADRCCSCGQCLEVCPEILASPAGGACRTCGSCVAACPTAARALVGEDLRCDEVLERVLRDRIFFDQSGGGVTFSGGEPLAQPRFLSACLDLCRGAGLHVALDTSGAAPREVLVAAAARSDLVLFDIKTTDPEAHERLVGTPLGPILANLRALSELGTRLWLRFPLVAGLNDRPRDVDGIEALLGDLGPVERICLLPYHATGTIKATRLQSAHGRAGPSARDAEAQTTDAGTQTMNEGRQLGPPSEARLDELMRRLGRHVAEIGVGS